VLQSFQTKDSISEKDLTTSLMNVIIKSGKRNWSGKEFSSLPAKVYSDFDDAVSALNSYHFFEFNNQNNEYVACEKKQKIEIIHITEGQREKLISAGKARI
jgi:hypothetical protein